LVKAFQAGAYSVIKSFKAHLTKKIVSVRISNKQWLKERINRLFWFDSKSTIQNSFQTFSETPKYKTIGCFNKTTGCFSLSLKNPFKLNRFENT